MKPSKYSPAGAESQPHPTHEEISQRAEQIWEQYGRPTDRDEEIWFEAEKQLQRPEYTLQPTTHGSSRRGEGSAVAAHKK